MMNKLFFIIFAGILQMGVASAMYGEESSSRSVQRSLKGTYTIRYRSIIGVNSDGTKEYDEFKIVTPVIVPEEVRTTEEIKWLFWNKIVENESCLGNTSFESTKEIAQVLVRNGPLESIYTVRNSNEITNIHIFFRNKRQ